MAEIKPIFTEELQKILKELESENNYVAFELMWMSEPDSKFHNGLRISKVDVSKQDYCFDVTIDGKTHPMKIGKFIRYFLANIIKDNEAVEFSKLYNNLKKGEKIQSGTPITIDKFSYNPRDVKATFLSLVTKTYPHGHEEEVLQFLPGLKKDQFGNYYKIIGNIQPQTMFTSHLDTADRQQKVTKLFSMVEDGEEYIYTDESTILGADDKSGVVVMLYMMTYNIPGLYYFFIGEERGGIGSNALASIFDQIDYLKNVKRCISFDRRNYHSVITSQLGRTCCSNEFGNALCDEYNRNGLSLSLDNTGIYTDSASFMDDIRECTNISVGYFNEHTGKEYQNITYLKNLCEASVKVNWNSLPSVRKAGLNEEVMKKHRLLIQDIKKSVFDLETKIVGEEGRVFIRVDLDETDVDAISNGLNMVDSILTKHKINNNDVVFTNTYMKIELR
jgi:hypothetical protein